MVLVTIAFVVVLAGLVAAVVMVLVQRRKMNKILKRRRRHVTANTERDDDDDDDEDERDAADERDREFLLPDIPTFNRKPVPLMKMSNGIWSEQYVPHHMQPETAATEATVESTTTDKQ